MSSDPTGFDEKITRHDVTEALQWTFDTDAGSSSGAAARSAWPRRPATGLMMLVELLGVEV